jgi:hypothetical protein
MLFNIPYYPIPSGYITATGSVKFNINNLNNFDFISINNNEIYYHNNPSEFVAPQFFNSKEVFIESVNASIDTFQVLLQTGDNDIILINSLLSGDAGNNIRLNSNNTGVIFNNSNLIGGQNLYPILYKPLYPLNNRNPNLVLPPFSGFFSNRFYVTGFYYMYGESAFLEGNINSFLTVRNFKNIWNIATGSVNRMNLIDFRLNNLMSGNNYYNLVRGVNTRGAPIDVRISYNNELSLSNNIDIVELTIKDLNAPQSRLSGIIFRITGAS